jgi:hypothetical protein
MPVFTFPAQATPLDGLETRRVLVLSTAHLRRPTLDLFGEQDFKTPLSFSLPLIAEHGYGFYLHVIQDADDLRDQLADQPADVGHVLRLAHRHGFAEVKLDSDGDPIADLPSYEESGDQWEARECEQTPGAWAIHRCGEDEPFVTLHPDATRAQAELMVDALYGVLPSAGDLAMDSPAVVIEQDRAGHANVKLVQDALEVHLAPLQPDVASEQVSALREALERAVAPLDQPRMRG